jgi:UDP-N-acetylglucosamine--N-acetylmuramyl-(pentapeptide) pyrophosphoryl-undecaprenol N-acetylglucosamine transferase
LPRASKDLGGTFEIRAGKFRRYHGESFISHLFDVPTNLKNIRDFFYMIAGFFQSLRLLGRTRPDAVFIKGGFVGVPVGFACRVRRIPYFTHDSDTVPGLANKLIAKHAVYHAVGMPAEFYRYPKSKTRYTGIPLSEAYEEVTPADQKKFRQALHIPEDAQVVSLTGGSLGAVRLNKSFHAIAESLLESFPKLHILHQTGSTEPLYTALPESMHRRVTEVAFTDELATFTGAADVVIARAGATTIAELAVQGKTCVVVPNPQLTGGQQTKNAAYLAKHHAAIVVTETEAEQPASFEQVISDLLRNSKQRKALSEAIAKLAKPHAAEELTAILVKIAQHK